MSSNDSFVENYETFFRSTYNGISVLIRGSGKYINAGRLCHDGKKNFYDIKRQKKWSEILDYYIKNECSGGDGNSRILDNQLKKGFKQAQGIYIHPDLIHFVAEWIDVKYAFAVKHIMDSINERSQKTGETFDEIKDEIIEGAEWRRKLAEQLSGGNSILQQKYEKDLNNKMFAT